MLALTALRVIFLKDLFAVVMLFGIYSFLSALIFVNLDAVDVAFTEASVGAGISTVLMLGTLALTGRTEKENKHSSVLPLLVVTVTGAALIYATLDMPPFGHPDNPIHQHVAPRYIEESPKEVGLPNMVTSVLASYRGFDTLGETVVVFSAAIGVISLLGFRRREENDTPKSGLKEHHVLRVVAKIIIPLIILFALYVQFHGDFGPGGGFQAGVIAAAAFILYALVFGLPLAFAVISPKFLQVMASFGVLLYAGVGLYSMSQGGQFLDYNKLAADPVAGQHYGILIIELGVGITVFAVMLSIFYAFDSQVERSNVQ
ncbi:cation:proton antiporter [Gammaproteobacteria bacterium 45_16_T64]|nr:cation:proton antiporter [Gammaproteobacteria bacterium 45_16_T64]